MNPNPAGGVLMVKSGTQGEVPAQPGQVLPANAGALDRGLAILTHVAQVRSCTVNEIGEVLGLTRSTTYRLVDRLRDGGWLKDGPSGTLMLGAAAAVLGAAAVGSSVLRETAIPTLRELLRRTQETVSLAIPKGDVMVFLHREQGPQPVAVSGQLGTSRPMHITSVGRAYLAALPGEQREDLLVRLLESPQYPIGVDDLPHIRAEIEATERRGWSADRREFDESSVCCGAAIYDEHGLPVAAISVAGVAGRMEGQLDEIGPQVRRAADLLSVTLGGRPPAFT